MIEALWLKLGPLLRVSFTSKGRLRDQFLQRAVGHDQLMKALAAKNPKQAADALRNIIRKSADWYRENYQFDEKSEDDRGVDQPKQTPKRSLKRRAR